MSDGAASGSDMWASTGAMARLIAGWACAAVGVLNLSMGTGTDAGTTDWPYLLFHLMLLIGGVLLLSLGRLRKPPGPFGYAVAGAAALLGLALTALPTTSTVCCMHDLAIRHGFPFTLLAQDPGRDWRFAPAHAAADLLFWVLIGVLVLIGIALVQPYRTASGVTGAHAARPGRPSRASARAARTPAAPGSRASTRAARAGRASTRAARTDRASTRAARTDPDSTHAARTDPDSTHAARTDPDSTRAARTDRASTHAEDRAGLPADGRGGIRPVAPAEQPRAPHDENVGGLP